MRMTDQGSAKPTVYEFVLSPSAQRKLTKLAAKQPAADARREARWLI